MNLMTGSPSEDTDQPVLSHSLICVVAFRKQYFGPFAIKKKLPVKDMANVS